MSLQHLKHLVGFNLWANQRLCEVILREGERIADREIQSSFPSIRKTLYHIWDGQGIWLARLNGESPRSWPSHDFNGNLQEAIQLFLENSNDFVRFVDKLPQDSEFSEVKYTAMDGTLFSNTIFEVICHLMNHGTYHRGQIVTMLRIAGVATVPPLDLIRFYREINKIQQA